jgi:aminocarboxymuconate-semialdehyde decarboxylase
MTTTDVHAHIVTPRIVKAAVDGATLHGIEFAATPDGRIRSRYGTRESVLPWPDFTETPEDRIGNMRAGGVDRQVLSLSPVLYLYDLDAGSANDFARMVNDELAELTAAHPQEFHAFGYVPLQDPAAAVAEIDRIMATPGFVGISMLTNVGGMDLDDPALFPVFQAAADARALVFIHPRGADRIGQQRYHLRNFVGNPLETTLAFGYLVFGGVLDRLPNLDVLLAHGGGYACLGIARFDHGHQLRPEANADHAPSEYLRRLYFDSLVHSPSTLRLVIERAGIERVMLASDYPADMGQPRPGHWIRDAELLSDAEKEAILGANYDAWLRATGRGA